MINKLFDYFIRFKKDIFKALVETFDMLIFSMIVTFIVGLIIGLLMFFTRKKGLFENKIIYSIFSSLVNIVRSIPFILFIIVLIPVSRFIIGTGFGVNASKIPLSLIGIATFARLSEQSFLEVNKDLYETSYSLGASKFQYFRYFLIKESRQSLVLSFTSTTISLISYSTVMGIIGGGGLGYLAISEGYQNFNYPLMWIIIILMIVLVQVIQATGNFIARKLDKR